MDERKVSELKKTIETTLHDAKEAVLKFAHLNRLMAKGVDILVVIVLATVLPRFIGPLLGFAYSLLADGFTYGPFKSQSFGKKLFDLQVRSLVRKAPGNYRDSVVRNAPVGLVTFFGIIPVWGWIIMALVGIPLLVMEIYLIEKMENAHRLGDVMADTEVVRLNS